jgi:hypothetical protein
VALFSEIDWAIILIVGGFLLFGQGSGPAVRQLGRYYGRAMRLKQELLAEFTREADLPIATGGAGLSLRQSLLGEDPRAGRVSGIPAAVALPPGGSFVGVALTASLPGPVGLGPETWSFARPSPDLGRLR